MLKLTQVMTTRDRDGFYSVASVIGTVFVNLNYIEGAQEFGGCTRLLMHSGAQWWVKEPISEIFTPAPAYEIASHSDAIRG